ncbi:MAG: lysophospholipid acyltransferase family protein [Caulobacteraceae bacterium]
MKRLVGFPAIQKLLGWLVWIYAWALTHTVRWRIEDPVAAEAALSDPAGAITLFWHGRLGHAVAFLPFLKSRARRILISLSRDGEFVAEAARRLGVPAIRGSAERPGELGRKGAIEALRESRRFLASGGMLLATPDGPRGPREVMSLGLLQLARTASCRVFLLGLAARPSVPIRSWDATRLPLPFARAFLVIIGPLTVPAVIGPEGAESLRSDWQQRMGEAQSRAEAALAGKSD